MSDNRSVLLCITGGSPAIVTETLWCLTQGWNEWKEKIQIDEIQVITTKTGKRLIVESLLKGGKFEEFRSDYPECSEVQFSEAYIHVLTSDKNNKPKPTDPEGIRLADVRTGDENESAANQIYFILRDLVEEGVKIHASAAGGRKTMGIYLTVMMQFLARSSDTLSHVVVWDRYENDSDFFYPKPTEMQQSIDLPISLSFIPYIPLREVGKDLLTNLTLGEVSYSEAVKSVRRQLQIAETENSITISIGSSSIRVGDITERISPEQLLVTLLYALNSAADQPTADADFSKEHFDQAFRLLTGGHFGVDHITREMRAENLVNNKIWLAHQAFKRIERNLYATTAESRENHLKRLREYRNRINALIEYRMRLAAKYRIVKLGDWGENIFGFEVETKIVD